MVGIRLFSVWEQNIDDLVANHHTDEKKEKRDEALRTSDQMKSFGLMSATSYSLQAKDLKQWCEIQLTLFTGC